MNLSDLVEFIYDSDLTDDEKRFLIKNLRHIEDTYVKKFGKNLDI